VPSPSFAQRAQEALERAADLVGSEVRLGSGSADDAVLDPSVDAIFEELREALGSQRGSRAAKLCLAALDLQRLRDEATARRTARRMAALRGVQAALGALHGVSAPEQLYELATAGLCTWCGFDRALLSSVTGDELVPQSVHFSSDPEWAQEILAFGRSEEGRPQLSELILETEMLRRRAPTIVLDPQNDPRATRPLVSATRTRSYVAAPILPEGRVIGFLHADCYDSGRDVDEIDRDTLWAFAEGCGYALERTLLRVHLEEQRERLQELVGSTAALAREMSEAEVALERSGRGALSASSRAAVRLAGPGDGLDVPLTPREREVLGLLVEGETNAGIARRLFVAESTAKAHVKHILRKLGASNRAEAVSRYLRHTGVDGSESSTTTENRSAPFGQ
jgi:DNA-binding CsgD family transcriptional regulator/GAF domain-containing protein